MSIAACTVRYLVLSRDQRFFGSRCQVQVDASEYALQWLPHFHRRALLGERG